MQRITRKLNPVIASYELIDHALGISTAEKKTYVLSFLTTSHGTNRFVRSVQSLSRCLVSSGVTAGVLRTCL